MKIYLLVGVVAVVFQMIHANYTTEVSTNQLPMTNTHMRLRIVRMIAKRMHSIWEEYEKRDENTFVGRCLGLARKIRQLLPIIIFLLGVILTKLGFLTLFSIKTMALVGLLLLLNASAFAAKIATAFALKGEHKHPQTVHFHVHKDSVEGYHIDHSSPWEHKSGEAGPEFDWDRVQSYNLYNKLLKESYKRSYEEFTR
ncbi:unnamed protein product [Acanthoscelides obtectus]|uniref:Uncharacterized protein n=1 Tax=Acanthoscelides obtectus TaxID=200917 RepID=A0A9P0M676_ACAOB|nr:unnamed protein product [Acanthoscelides obtectus]CAK1670876.1 hypothetical protein AOBTE_LOCUS27889 [Acanthoscelides obtectus]